MHTRSLRLRPGLAPVAALVVAAALGGCADDGPTLGVALTDSVVTADATVRIERSRFSESELRVAPGTTVRFVNDDAFAHTVTSRSDSPLAFDSGELGDGETFEITFDTPGEYAYFCRIHPTMRAVVVVG